MNGRMFDKVFDAAPGFILGLTIGTFWSYALGFISFAFGIGGLSGQTPSYAFLFHPTISILPVAILFSILRKRNVVSGILIIAIAVALYLGHLAQSQAADAVRESGRPFLSAVIQHFRYKLSGPHSSSMNQP
ncbi:MAG TPA: hypothetical protein VFN26_16460 [Candidatus Acidoferrum sp.]|nr:hypothetical protein [Candidatus Acidoferrum sp.]